MKEKLYIQIYKKLKSDILSGALYAGAKLPSKRQCARTWGASVITVENAYALLVDEGFVVPRERSGYYVAGLSVTGARPLSREVRASGGYSGEVPVDLSRGAISPEFFPFSSWARIMRRQLTERSSQILGGTGVKGAGELREAICGYLFRTRGIDADPDNVVIGAGPDHLCNLLLQLLKKDRVYGAEDPGYLRFFEICRVNGAKCVPLSLDGRGVSLDALENTPASVLHLTPSHHFPTGCVMDAPRRLAVLNWAYSHPDRFVVEDDFESEFSFRPKPENPLFALDTGERVIYMNTFSRTIAPSVRISYMILPPGLMRLFEKELGFYSCSVSALEQFTLAQFISDGFFERHIYRTSKLYLKKRERVTGIIFSSPFADKLTPVGESTGLHFLVRVDTSLSRDALAALAASSGIRLRFLSDYTLSPPSDGEKPVVIVNYPGIDEKALEEALGRLENSLKT
ncbi:MAG: PLP-dependent aminotransferase family protein [Clostridia bacterium]|nr:PLP-dependent aminotransferase family protein [Clostridia bacterium]